MTANLKFSANLQSRLEQKKLSRSEFAEQLGIDPAQVHHYLNGTVPRAARLLEIAIVLNVLDLDAFLNGTPEEFAASLNAPARFGHIKE